MNISTLTKLSGLVSFILSLVTLTLLYKVNVSLDEERHSVLRQQEFHKLGDELEHTSDFMTREARSYAVFGEQHHLDAYLNELNVLKTRDKVVERVLTLGATPTEKWLIETAKANSDSLVKVELQAINAVKQGNFELAKTLMFNNNYDINKARILTPLNEFQRELNLRAEKEAIEARNIASVFLWLTNATIISYVLLVFFALYFIFFRHVSRPLDGITNAINTIASGKTDTSIPYSSVNNEIGELARTAALFQESLIANQDLAARLQKHKDDLELTVQARTKDLSEANNELEEFTYRTSHDLRSPIISSSKLLSITELSINNGDNDKALKSLSLAKNSLQKLEKLIADLLQLTETKNRIEENQEEDIDELVESALDKMAFMDGIETIEIIKDLQCSGKIQTKKSRFNTILENLISNAIKYQDPEKDQPFIKISTRQNHNEFILEVEDNGLGIPPDQVNQLFIMFKRFHPKTSYGTGLGLYMMKKSADILNGEISFHHRDDGAMFRLSIPIIEK